MGKLKDARLVARALREHWPIPPEIRQLAITTLGEILSDKTASKRTKVSAARALFGAGKCNNDGIRTAAFCKRLEGNDAMVAAAEENATSLAAWFAEQAVLAGADGDADGDFAEVNGDYDAGESPLSRWEYPTRE